MTYSQRTPRGRGGLLLYLDFDGVLHHDEVYRHPRRGIYINAGAHFTLFQHASLLETELAPYPEVRIVLATSWVRELRYSRALKHLPLRLRTRVIGSTYHTAMNVDAFRDKPRGMQVLEDVSRRQPQEWLALDNDDRGWPQELRDRLILTDDVLGISKLSVHATMKREFARRFGGAHDS